MISILLDSSNTNLSVGVAKDNLLLDYVSYEAWQRQSEFMIVELNKLLEKHQVKNDDIKEVIVAKGPGSYTGVRIAITIAKTIAVSLHAELYAVSSLRVEKEGTCPSICVINARSGRSYVGVYQDQSILLDDCIMKNDDLLKYIDEHPEYSVCGDTKYLGINGKENNNLQAMLDLKDSLESVNPLALKPVYMKD